jgi:hypothetical protein
MAKNKYALFGFEMGAANVPVMKELVSYEGDALQISNGFVEVTDNDAQNFTVAVIRLDEGQSIKRIS